MISFLFCRGISEVREAGTFLWIDLLPGGRIFLKLLAHFNLNPLLSVSDYTGVIPLKLNDVILMGGDIFPIKGGFM